MSDVIASAGSISSMLPPPSEQLRAFMTESSSKDQPSASAAVDHEKMEPEFIEHVVNHKKDTLIGLSLKYGVAKTEIILHNDLPSSGNLTTVKVLKIPLQRATPPKKQDPPQSHLTEQVKIRTFIKEHGVSEGEARYYLNECNGRYSDAVKMFLDDEKTIPINSTKPSRHQNGKTSVEINREVDAEETTTLLPAKENISSSKGMSTSTLRHRKVYN